MYNEEKINEPYWIKYLTYTHTAGAAKRKESKRSKKPPCPGMMLPLSLTPAILFNLLSNKSPNVPNIAQSEEMIIQFCSINVLGNNEVLENKSVIATTQRIAPPIVPSHVFLGDIFEKGVLPMNEPTM